MKTKNTPISSKENVNDLAEVIKLGLDIHASKYVVARQVDEAPPQSAQSFDLDGFMRYVGKQLRLGKKVYCCYEAGCFGYWLHRRLEAMAVTNFVVRARNWDEYGKRVKTDSRDATALLNNLDRYLHGNRNAMTPVRIPSEEGERKRSRSRQRDSLNREKKRLANQGNSLARYYGYNLPEQWWKPKKFARLKESLPEYLFELLAVWQQLLVPINEALKQATAEQEKHSAKLLPVGLGALTVTVLDSEVCDWNRFKNRKQVASYTGLCPGEHSSGESQIQGSITKHGNRRLRHLLIEAAWRLLRYQSDYKAVVYWKERIVNGPKLTSARKKKIAVAIARQFMVDWWRIQTGQMKAEDIGLQLALPQANSLKTWRIHQLKQQNEVA
jgi:transposase